MSDSIIELESQAKFLESQSPIKKEQIGYWVDRRLKKKVSCFAKQLRK